MEVLSNVHCALLSGWINIFIWEILNVESLLSLNLNVLLEFHSNFLKGEQMFLLSFPLSFRHLLLLHHTAAAVVLLCLPVLGPRQGQGFSSVLFWRTSSLRGLLVRWKPARLLTLSEATRSLFFLAISLFELLSDEETLHQQRPVGDGPFFFFLK